MWIRPLHHQSRRAAYTSGKVPLFLFKVVWLRWMCQLSSMHWVVVCWCWSSTTNLLRSTAWPVSSTCSARADAWTSPFFKACRCSLTHCFRHFPVWPMYTFEAPLTRETLKHLKQLWPLVVCTKLRWIMYIWIVYTCYLILSTYILDTWYTVVVGWWYGGHTQTVQT